MTTQTEARELAQRFGTRMCDENGDTHGEELYCLGLDDIVEMVKTLAQPEQEHVADREVLRLADAIELRVENKAERMVIADKLRKLAYTTPPQRKPLTDEQLLHIYVTTKGFEFYRVFARAIEAAHGIKE